jgi:hypothetical protein
MTPRIAIESGWALSGRQLFALGPCRDVAAVDREREQVGERVRGARERGMPRAVSAAAFEAS